jgi:hypothetical protein
MLCASFADSSKSYSKRINARQFQMVVIIDNMTLLHGHTINLNSEFSKVIQEQKHIHSQRVVGFLAAYC